MTLTIHYINLLSKCINTNIIKKNRLYEFYLQFLQFLNTLPSVTTSEICLYLILLKKLKMPFIMRSIKQYTNDVLSKVSIKNISILAFCIYLSLVSFISVAVDSELDKQTTVFNQTFSWQAMAGFSIDYTQSPLKSVKQEDIFDHLSLSVMIDLYYKGFFIQTDHRRSGSIKLGAEIGYQLYVDEYWELDILSKSYISSYSPDELIENKNEDIPTLVGLAERKMGDAITLRYSYFKDDAVLSLDLASLSPFSETDGWLVDFYYNDLIIYRNWDIYVGGGLTYYSGQVVDYYYGVKEEEVTAFRSFYKPDDGFKGTFEIYARHPISQNWSFNLGITQTYYSNVIKRSPLVAKQHISQFLLGVFYVF